MLNVIVPTTPCKMAWLRRTISGIKLQDVKTRVLVVVDRKPWDTDDPTLWEDGLGENVHVYHLKGASKLKRSHEAVNVAMRTIDENAPVMVVDDDYLLKRVDAIRTMLDRSRPGVVVTPKSFDEISRESLWLACDPVVDESGGIRWFNDGVVRNDPISCAAEKRGQHPMCGHPKILYPRDFLSVGGLRHDRFPHYWWCDTDLYYRMRKLYTFEHVDVPCMHVDHERYNPALFARPNASRFVVESGGYGDVDEKHLEAARNQRSM